MSLCRVTRAIRVGLLLAFSVAAAACSPGPKAPVVEIDDAPGDAILSPEGVPIAIRRSLVADQYFWLRTKVLEGEAPPAFGASFGAMHDLRADLSADPTAWEDLEVPLGVVSSATELLAIYERLPEKKDVGGVTVSFRAAAVRLAQASTPAGLH